MAEWLRCQISFTLLLFMQYVSVVKAIIRYQLFYYINSPLREAPIKLN
jgi:hypothetical protein